MCTEKISYKGFDTIMLNSNRSSNRCSYSKQNLFGSGMTASIIWNKEMNDITKIIKPLKDTGVLIKTVSKTIEN